MKTVILTLALFAFTGSVKAAPAEIRLTPEEAVRRALRYNLSLRIDRLAPELSSANERAARAAFDPVFFGETGVAGQLTKQPSTATSHGEDVTAAVGIRKKFATGTTVEARVGGSVLLKDRAAGMLKPGYQADVSLSVRQSILQGAKAVVNESEITAGRLGREAADHQLRRKAELAAAQTLKAYWELYAALSNLKVQKVALENSRRTLNETVSLIKAGKLAPAEEVPTRYLVQTQLRAVLLAEKELSNARDKLARLIGLVQPKSMDTPQIVPVGQPVTRLPIVNLRRLQELALKRRGDHQALETEVAVKNVRARAARDLLLPKLDLVASVGVTGLRGDPANVQSALDPASRSSADVAWAVGLVLEVPLGFREAKAQRELADLQVRRANLSVKNSIQSVSEELNVAFRAVQAAFEYLNLTRSAVKLAQTKLNNEMDRYREGKTTAQILTMVQAELVKEELNMQDAVAKYNQALVDLRTASGTLIDKVR